MKVCLIILLLVPGFAFSQLDSSFLAKIKALDTANTIKYDTVRVVDDAVTRKIKLLRSERLGVNAESIMLLKIAEEQSKDGSHSVDYYKQLIKEVTTGKTATLLENSLINLYRRTYTENEIDELIAFYKTSAGKKMNKENFLLLLQASKDAEQLLKLASTKTIQK